MRAVIIGAGIGGLAAAVALRKVGVEVLVVERAPAIHEIGAGLSIWLNAIRALRELDVDSALAPCSSVVERILSRTSSGRPIGIIDLRNLSGDVGIACICVHRADLQHVLLEALPPGAVRTGSNCVAFDGTDAILASGERISGDALIGADGISSVVRAALHGAHPPRYAGYTCWRGICNNEDVLPERAALLVTAAGSQFGAWPCRPGQIYCFSRRTRQRQPAKLEPTLWPFVATGLRRFPTSSKPQVTMPSCRTTLSTGRLCAGGVAGPSRCWETRRMLPRRTSAREHVRPSRTPSRSPIVCGALRRRRQHFARTRSSAFRALPPS